MTTEAGVYIDDVKLQDIGVRVRLSSEEPALPNVRNQTVSIPGRHGQYDFGAYFDAREFALDCVLERQDSYSGMKSTIDVLVRLLTDEYGRPKTVELRFEDAPERYFNARLSSAVPLERLARLGIFTLPMTAYDPHSYAGMNAYDPEETYEYDRDYEYDIGLMYDNPQGFEWIYERHYSGVNNYSSIGADFVVEIVGTVTNPIITNLTSNQTLLLPDVSNGVIEVDSSKYSVLLNGNLSLARADGEFFTVQPGEVGFLFEGDNPNATVNYRWLHKFM